MAEILLPTVYHGFTAFGEHGMSIEVRFT